MGHSVESVTMNVYAHNSYEKAEESRAKILSFSEIQPPKRKKCSG